MPEEIEENEPEVIPDGDFASVAELLAEFNFAAIVESAQFTRGSLRALLAADRERKKKGQIPLMRVLQLMHEGLMVPQFEKEKPIFIDKRSSTFDCLGTEIYRGHDAKREESQLAFFTSISMPAEDVEKDEEIGYIFDRYSRKFPEDGMMHATPFHFRWFAKHREVAHCAFGQKPDTLHIFAGFPVFLPPASHTVGNRQYPALYYEGAKYPEDPRRWKMQLVSHSWKPKDIKSKICIACTDAPASDEDYCIALS